MENEENLIISPTDDINERLWANREDPRVAAAYDQAYGEGAADSYLNTRAGTAPVGEPRVIPEASIQLLNDYRDSPELPAYAEAFDRRYGAGASQSVLTPVPETQEEGPQNDLGLLGTIWDATGQSVIGGVGDAISGTLQTADDLSEYAQVRITGDLVRTEEGWTYMRGQELQDWYDANDGGSILDLATNVVDYVTPETQTGTGRVVRGISTFVVPYLGAAKALQVGTSITRGIALGAAVDFTVWDPDDPNLSAMVNELGLPQNFMTDLMATDPDDPAMVNRLRNAAEGAILGTVVDGLLAINRAVRAGRAAEAAGDAVGVEAARAGIRGAVRDLEEAAGQQAGEIIQGNVQAARETAQRIADASQEAAEAAPTAPARATTEGTTEAATEAATEAPQSSSGFRITQQEFDEIDRLAQSYATNPAEAFSKALPYRSPTTYRGWDDFQANLAAVRNVMSDKFDEIAGGSRQTFEQVQDTAMARLNDMAEVAGRQPEDLLREWDSLNVPPERMAAEILARDNMLLAMEREVRDLATQINAQSVDNARFKNLDEARAELMYRRELIANLLARQSAARTNIGRALNAFKIARNGDQRMRDLVRGGLDSSDIDSFARAVAEGGGRPGRVVQEMSNVQKFMDTVSNYRINALLSGPGTQEINVISSGINTLMVPLRTALGGQFRHGVRQVAGMVTGSIDSLRMAKRALMEDGGVLDPGNTKFDGEDLAKGNKGIVRGTISLPSRFLLTVDELFKQSMFRGWIAADAAASADAAGLRGAARRDHIQQYIRESFTPDGQANGVTRSEALEMAQRATFTEPLRPKSLPARFQSSMLVGQGQGVFLARLVIPFFRTPVNILKQSFQHMPILNRLSQEMREDLAAGGARAAQARSKVYLGWAATSAALYYALDGRITGSGPSDPLVNAEWRAAGNQPYSIRFTNENGEEAWFNYQRLEPLANVISIVADTVELMKNPYNEEEATTMGLLGGIALAIGENSVNKTFTAGISDFFDVMQGERTAERGLYNFVGSFSPNLINQLNGDDAFREIRSVADTLNSRLGSYENVAPRRNLLGEVITRPTSKADPLGLFTGNGFRAVDPVLQELSRVSMADRAAFQQPSHGIVLEGRRTSLKDIRHSETNRPLYDMWVERTGTIELGGQNLRGAIDRVMQTSAYQDAPEGGPGTPSDVMTKGRILSRIISEYRQAARADIPELQAVIRQSEAEGRQMAQDQYLTNRENRRAEDIDPFSSLNVLTGN